MASANGRMMSLAPPPIMGKQEASKDRCTVFSSISP